MLAGTIHIYNYDTEYYYLPDNLFMTSLLKNVILFILILFFISVVFSFFLSPFETTENLSITQLVEKINQGKVKKIIVSGNELQITYQDGKKAVSRKEAETSLSQSLINYGIDKEKLSTVDVESKETGGIWVWLGPVLFSILPLLLFGVFFLDDVQTGKKWDKPGF